MIEVKGYHHLPVVQHGGITLQTIGFIGLGNMGSRMALNLHRAGYPLVVHDTRPESMSDLVAQGATPVDSASQVAAKADVILTSLPGPSEVELVAKGPQGIARALRQGHVYVDLSTSRPSLIRDIEVGFRAQGAHVLDAPVSGGTAGAASRNLAVLVGGERKIFEHVQPVLEAIGDKVYYAGPIGSGTICKLVHNAISMAVRQSIAEGLTLGVKAGMETEALWQAVRRGALGRMAALHEVLPRSVFQGAFDTASFALELSRKDLGLALDLAEEYNVPMPSIEHVRDVQSAAVDRGWAKRDSSVTFLLQEEAAGVELRAPEVDPAKAATFITTHPEG